MQVTEYMGAGARQFGFMLRGLKLLEPELAKLGIPFFLLKGKPEDTLPKLCKDAKAALLVADQSPMKLARSWRTKVILIRCACPLKMWTPWLVLWYSSST